MSLENSTKKKHTSVDIDGDADRTDTPFRMPGQGRGEMTISSIQNSVSTYSIFVIIRKRVRSSKKTGGRVGCCCNK